MFFYFALKAHRYRSEGGEQAPSKLTFLLFPEGPGTFSLKF